MDQVEGEGLGSRIAEECRARGIETLRVAGQFRSAAEDTRVGNAKTSGIHLVLRAAEVDSDLRVGRGISAADVNLVHNVQLAAGSKADVRCLLRYLRNQLLIFRVDVGTIAAERSAGRLGRERLEPVQNRGDVAESTVCDLQLTDTVVGVQYSLCKLRNAAVVLVRNCETGGVVTGLIDSEA